MIADGKASTSLAMKIKDAKTPTDIQQVGALVKNLEKTDYKDIDPSKVKDAKELVSTYHK